MADTNPASPHPSDTPSSVPSGSGIPLAPEPPRSLLEDSRACPKCGQILVGENDVVCVKCGYNLKENVVLKPVVGTPIEVDREAALERSEPFVLPGRGSPQVVFLFGAVFTITAMVAAGITAPRTGALTVAAAVLLVIYQVALQTGTGIAAVWGAAKVGDQKFGAPGAPELAAARIFLAYSLFELAQHINYPALWGGQSKSITFILSMLFGCGAYLLAIMILFRKPLPRAAAVGVFHIIMWVLVQLGMMLASYVDAAAVTGAVSAPK